MLGKQKQCCSEQGWCQTRTTFGGKERLWASMHMAHHFAELLFRLAKGAVLKVRCSKDKGLNKRCEESAAFVSQNETSHVAGICTQFLTCFPYDHTCLKKYPCWLQSISLPSGEKTPTYYTIFLSCCFSSSHPGKFLSATPNTSQHAFSKAHEKRTQVSLILSFRHTIQAFASTSKPTCLLDTWTIFFL